MREGELWLLCKINAKKLSKIKLKKENILFYGFILVFTLNL